MNNINTSGWRFEEDFQATQGKKFEPWKRTMPSTQRKTKFIEETDNFLEKETRSILLEEFEKRQFEEIQTREEEDQNSEYEHLEEEQLSKFEDDEQLRNLKEQRLETNPYLVLLNRLDEEEGVRTPSIEDKLKLAEDQLRISTRQFCKTCEEIMEENGSENLDTVDRSDTLLSPEVVQEAFRPKLFDPSCRPPQTLSVSEVIKKPMIETSDIQESKKGRRKEMKSKEILKQGYYLPSKSWFTKKKGVNNISLEELEILKSTSTKAFMKFLEDRKKEPPKVLEEIQKKGRSMEQ